MVNITIKKRRIRHKTSINAQGSPTYTLHKRRNAISKLTINTLLFLQNDVGQDLKIGSPSPWLHKSIPSILMDMSQLQRYWALTNLDKKRKQIWWELRIFIPCKTVRRTMEPYGKAWKCAMASKLVLVLSGEKKRQLRTRAWAS